MVLAGGTGTRVGLSIPKQLIKIAGKPIIEHTIAAMQQSPLIDEIVVMMAPGYLDEVREIVRRGEYTKVSQILEGADTRNDARPPGRGWFAAIDGWRGVGWLSCGAAGGLAIAWFILGAPGEVGSARGVGG